MGQAGLEGVWGLWSLRIHCGNATREREPSRSKIKGHCEAGEDTAGRLSRATRAACSPAEPWPTRPRGPCSHEAAVNLL